MSEGFEEYLGQLRLSELPELDEAMRYSLLAGGKRVRPRLCLAAARSAGADPRLALPAAAALELVHTFSLVHDDLPALDDDSLRRGRATSHVRYGEGVAVLVGDALLNRAFALVSADSALAAEVRVALLGELALGVAGMIDGQYLDVTAERLLDVQALAEMHGLKTGSLISASVACGLHVAGLGLVEQQPYRAFAAELGLLFQIVDDVLDATGLEGELGKAPGADAKRGKQTYVTVLGLERARALGEEAHERTLALLAQVPGETGELAELVELIAVRTS
jgi:geranylgeranyl diphosphate synthase type II